MSIPLSISATRGPIACGVRLRLMGELSCYELAAGLYGGRLRTFARSGVAN